MDLRFKTNLLEHMKAIGGWARQHGINALVDPVTFELQLHDGNRRRALNPLFVGRPDGTNYSYFATPEKFAVGFVGWLPYPVQAWDISRDKLLFKRLVTDLGLKAPEMFTHPGQAKGPFLVKRRQGSFGDGLRGPFMPGTEESRQLRLADGEFIESFKTPRIARAWYWADQLAVLELFDMPAMTGDGRSTYVELLFKRIGGGALDIPQNFAHLCRLAGQEPQDIVPAGKQVLIDYRYVSPFNPTVYTNSNVITTANPRALQHFSEAGRVIWPHLPIARRHAAAYVIDAIVDRNDQPWLLELNCNPQLHPDIYSVMLASLMKLAVQSMH